jgi:histone H3/H4
MPSPSQDAPDADHYRVCSTCKKPIAFEATYYRCSVSTCNRARVAYYFCSVPCWDAHVPEQRHRDAWAEPAKAPTRAAHEAELAREREEEFQSADPAPTRRVVATRPDTEVEREILVVVSKLKTYIRARSGLSTSDGVMEVLSDHLRKISDQAIQNAQAAGRKTVMERDFRSLLDRDR